LKRIGAVALTATSAPQRICVAILDVLVVVAAAKAWRKTSPVED
jgi:hypothetical protein